MIDAVTARGKQRLGDHRFELFDFAGNGRVARNGVVNRCERVRLDTQRAAIEADHQFAQIASIHAGLHDGRAAVDDDGLVQFGVSVSANHDVNAGNGLRQTHILAISEGAILVLLEPAVTQADDDVHLLSLSKQRHHFLGGLDRVGIGDRAGVRVEHGLLAHESEQAETQSAALDHGMTTNHSFFAQAFQPRQCGVVLREVGVRGHYRRDVARLRGDINGAGQRFRPEVEIMVTERRRVVAHSRQELQFGTRMADRRTECRPHAVVARIENQHRALTSARRLPLPNQGGQPRKPATRLVIVQRARGVVAGRTEPNHVRVKVVGMQDGECLATVACGPASREIQRAGRRADDKFSARERYAGTCSNQGRFTSSRESLRQSRRLSRPAHSTRVKSRTVAE